MSRKRRMTFEEKVEANGGLVPAQPGRDCKYKPEMDNTAYKLALLGLDDKDIASILEISTTTLYRWKQDFPSFREAIKDGGIRADAEVAHSLYLISKGYTDTKKKIKVDPITGAPLEETIETFNVAPVPSATKLWLGNRQRGKWRQSNDEFRQLQLEMQKMKMEFDQEMQRERLALEKEKLEIMKLKASMGVDEELEDDGFIEALTDQVSDVWDDLEEYIDDDEDGEADENEEA